MYTGRDMTRTIEGRLRVEQEAFDVRTRQVEVLVRDHAGLVAEEEGILDALARIHLPDLAAGSVTRALGEVRSSLLDILSQHDARKGELRDRIEQSHVRLAEAESERARLEAEEDALDGARRREEKAVSDKLLGDPEYVSLGEERQKLELVAGRLERVRKALGALARVEGPRYERDLSFRYLRDRHWGQPDYRGGFVARRMDGWLARTTDYDRTRRHHELLRFGPRDMEVQIGQTNRRLDELGKALQETEKHLDRSALHEVLRKMELVVARRRGTAEARERAREAYESDAMELRTLEMSQGRYYEEALALHRSALSGKDAATLLRMAQETPSPEDDHLVERLEGIRRDVDIAQRSVGEAQEVLLGAQQRLDDLLLVARVVAQRFGDHRSRFRSGVDLTALLDDLVAGRVEPKEATKRIASFHVVAPRWDELRPLAREAMKREESTYDVWWFDGPMNAIAGARHL